MAVTLSTSIRKVASSILAAVDFVKVFMVPLVNRNCVVPIKIWTTIRTSVLFLIPHPSFKNIFPDSETKYVGARGEAEGVPTYFIFSYGKISYSTQKKLVLGW